MALKVIKSMFVGMAAIASAAAVATAGSAASAQSTGVSNPHGVVQNFDPENLGPVLSDLGVAWREERAADGSRYIQASVGSNFAFNILPTACLVPEQSTGCIGANYIALFKGVGINYQTVSAFNQKFAFSTAGVMPGGRDAYISRYEIADFGIARGNLVSSMSTFIYLAERFRNEITASSQTVSDEGFAEDLAAARLNQKAAVAMGVAVEPTTMAEVHRAGFEQTPEFIRMLSKDENAATNKISNKVGR